jgi:hypothetical protein
MAYQVDKFNGTFLVSVDDGTIDTTTDLRFVGKNYAGYGEVQNENFLHLMENFANSSPPPKVVTGQIWFDTANKKLKFYDGTQFRTAGGAEARTTAPSGLTIGDFWFDTSAEQLYAWNGTEYILIGPENAPDTGTSALIPQVVKDTVGVNHSIGKLLSGGDVIAVISKDAFTLNSSLNPITGFSVIKKGINLVNTAGSTGVTTTDHFFWGSASNSLKLGGFSADDFVRAGSTLSGTFNATGIGVSDTGITIGDQNDLRIFVENGDEPAIENQLGNTVKIKIRVSESASNTIAIFQTFGMLPGTDNTFALGSSGSKWSQVHSTDFFGNLTGNVTGDVLGTIRGNVLASDGSVVFNASTKNITATFNGLLNGNVVGDVIGTANNALALNGLISNTAAVATTLALRDPSGNLTANRFLGIVDFADRLKIDDSAVDTNPTFRSAKTTATANTIAARDSSGNLTANIFNGTATAARYADLAENYLADKNYEIGTVIAVGGEKEVRAAMFGERAIGVVSEKPAYLMNKDLEGGTAIALKGRVPVKVVGSVRKGDRLISSDNGVAVVAAMHSFADVFAISLEDNRDTSVKLVEAIVL